MKERPRRRRRTPRYGKEWTLLSLSLFYFVIATNTQTGWLFVLSAFLLGLLVTAWVTNRKVLQYLELSCKWQAEPIKGTPFRVNLELRNTGPGRLSEIRLECDPPAWALESEPSLHVVPRLGSGQKVTIPVAWTPNKRGEHRLPGTRLTSGAPFGLFERIRVWEWDQSFLIYPALQRLPARGSAALATAYLSEAVARRGQGDSSTLKGVRDYRPGDDLRYVHWKASAKRGPGAPLQVREHLAPAPMSSTFVLDTSGQGSGFDDDLFEQAVTLAASVLWSAHKEGVSARLLLSSTDGDWQVWNHWSEQYVALARVQREEALSFQQWISDSEDSHHFVGGHRKPTPILIKAGDQSVDCWPVWARRVLLCVDSMQSAPRLEPGPEISMMENDAYGAAAGGEKRV